MCVWKDFGGGKKLRNDLCQIWLRLENIHQINELFSFVSHGMNYLTDESLLLIIKKKLYDSMMGDNKHEVELIYY